MRKPEVITFDAAGTLIRVRWNPGQFAIDCARALGLDVPDERAANTYRKILASRWPEFVELNQTRDHASGDRFWREITEQWLAEIGHPIELADPMLAKANEILYAPDSVMFELYEDAIPTLDRLRDLGVRLAVISNWDYSLHRVLESKGIRDRFELVVASLEEGVEKPDPRLFRLVLKKMQVMPEDAAHVGDDLLDDFQGALDVGMQAVWLDRQRTEPTGRIVPSLSFVPEVLGWTD